MNMENELHVRVIAMRTAMAVDALGDREHVIAAFAAMTDEEEETITELYVCGKILLKHYNLHSEECHDGVTNHGGITFPSRMTSNGKIVYEEFWLTPKEEQ